MNEYWHIKVANKFGFDNHIGTFEESDRLWNLLESLYVNRQDILCHAI